MAQSTSLNIVDNIVMGKESPIDDNINIGELILKAFKIKPDFVGQVDAITGEENTFDQMRERSVKCALWLKKFGVQRNDIVVVCTSNYLDAYIPFLASLYIDATLIVWRENRPINYRHYMRSGPKVIFTDVDKVSSILNVANMLNISTKIIVLFEEEEEEKEETEKVESINSILMNDFDEAEVDEFSCIKLESNKDIAVILFSVGTIGDIRKHVTIPYAFFTSPSNQHVPIMSSNDVGMWNESLHWNISLLLTVRCILSYVKAIKINEFLYPSLEMSFCNIIEKFKVTWVFLKISMGNHFYHFNVFKRYNLSSLKQIIFGGRLSIFPTIFDNFIISLQNASVIQVYCLPEVGMITYQEKTGKSESSGYVCNNVNLAITHYISGILLEANKLGIIQCKSPCLTNGCFSSLPVDLIPLPDDNNGWFCTDDVGYYDSDGELYVLDRTKNIIQYRYNYFLPASIEQLLRKHPKVRDCAVIPLYNTLDVHHPLAIVVPNKGAKIVQEELIQFVSENAVDCLKLRGGVLFRHALKYLRNGQLDRRTLHKWAKDDLHDKAYFSRKASQKKT
ncbi:luciferin 4-monooxygenase-like isoform X2 [Cataglyphis hispanica]|uniref:luciferin 4-monooxygenase-like isoform X2 n=1 Tax=Cataglyphis hispanica TaxID=1086592 RepID=UPI0021802B9D|nr:luciferin 4-monooxygenase-like isoform X2 [Cataglyphis hispanica]